MNPLQNVQSHKYQTREQFLHDVDLIHQNCEKYNGPGSNYTKTALKMSDLCRERLQEVRRPVVSVLVSWSLVQCQISVERDSQEVRKPISSFLCFVKVYDVKIKRQFCWFLYQVSNFMDLEGLGVSVMRIYCKIWFLLPALVDTNDVQVLKFALQSNTV